MITGILSFKTFMIKKKYLQFTRDFYISKSRIENEITYRFKGKFQVLLKIISMIQIVYIKSKCNIEFIGQNYLKFIHFVKIKQFSKKDFDFLNKILHLRRSINRGFSLYTFSMRKLFVYQQITPYCVNFHLLWTIFFSFELCYLWIK